MSKELFAAIDQHDASRVKALLAGGADPNEPQSQRLGLRPLHVAINELSEGGGLDVVLALLEHGADVNAWNVGRDVTPLLVAVFEENSQRREGSPTSRTAVVGSSSPLGCVGSRVSVSWLRGATCSALRTCASWTSRARACCPWG